jgi:hypothetical protein
VDLDEAVELTRTGDLWLFRGSSIADRAIRVTTNSPVNHVGMAVVLDDLPPLMWHAELGRSLPDAWTGKHHRGVQLHDLRDAVVTWEHRYGQKAWLRQLDYAPGAQRQAEVEDAVLRTIARLNGTPFPSTAKLAGRWLAGRRTTRKLRSPFTKQAPPTDSALETAYCAEVVAVTFEAMGLIGKEHPSSWYDPGTFWSGEKLELLDGARLGSEIPVHVPDDATVSSAPAASSAPASSALADGQPA